MLTKVVDKQKNVQAVRGLDHDLQEMYLLLKFSRFLYELNVI